MAATTYQHYVPAAPLDPTYEERLSLRLVRSRAELEEVLQLQDAVVAWDTETTGLDPTTAEIVGYSWSTDGRTGWYCPVSHLDSSIPGAIELFAERLQEARLQLLYNARYDYRMLRTELQRRGVSADISYARERFLDVMNLVWLADTNVPMPSLKWATRHFLGYQPPTYAETVGAAADFRAVPVEAAYRYAALDACNTYQLWERTLQYHEEAGVAGVLDQQMIWIMQYLEETPLPLDAPLVDTLVQQTAATLADLEQEIYLLAGRTFNIRSNRDLTAVFTSLGIDTGERTLAGDMRVGILLLNRVLAQYPDLEILRKIIAYKEQYKFYTTYLLVLQTVAHQQAERPVRFSYKLQGADTTRLTCCGADTVIYTTAGACRIADYVDGTPVALGNGRYAPARLVERGVQPVLQVTWETGMVGHYTPDHRVLVWGDGAYGWQELRDVVPGTTRVCTPYAPAATSIDPELQAWSYLAMVAQPTPGGWWCPLPPRTERTTLLALSATLDYPVQETPAGLLYTDPARILAACPLLETAIQQRALPATMVTTPAAAAGYIAGLLCTPHYTNYSDPTRGSLRLPHAAIVELRKVCAVAGLLLHAPRAHQRTKQQQTWNCTVHGTTWHAYVHGGGSVGRAAYAAPPFLSDYVSNHPTVNYTLYHAGAAGRAVLRNLRQRAPINLVHQCIEQYQLGLTVYGGYRILSCVPAGEQPVYTLAVDDPTHQYLADCCISENCGKETKNPYFAPLNLQSLPKPAEGVWYLRAATATEVEQRRDVLGWYPSSTPPTPEEAAATPHYAVSAYSPDLNLRRAFLPSGGAADYYVSIDMSGEELRIVANMYRETFFADVFNSGGDLHRVVSDQLFGPENYNQHSRQRSKWASFGMLYGQGPVGFAARFPGMSIEEATAFLERYKRLIPRIVHGQQHTVSTAQRTGVIRTFYGHACRVRHYFNSPHRGDYAYGVRKCKNTPIQGCAAEVLKLEFLRLWEHVFTQYPQVRFHSTIHDEINFSVPRELAAEVLPLLLKCMTVEHPTWLVPLVCSLEVGYNMGTTFPFEYDAATRTFRPEGTVYTVPDIPATQPPVPAAVAEAQEVETGTDVEEGALPRRYVL